MRRCQLQSSAVKEIFTDPGKALGKYCEKRQDSLNFFKIKLELQATRIHHNGPDSAKINFPAIPVETFSGVVTHYEETSAKELAQFIKRPGKGNCEELRFRFLQYLFTCLTHFNAAYWDQHIGRVTQTGEKKTRRVADQAVEYYQRLEEEEKKSRKDEEEEQENITELFQKNKFELLETNETFQIVNDLMLEADAKTLDGKMKIVRTTTRKDANMLYTSLILARNVASNQNKTYTFEVIRDFGAFTLDNFQVKYDSSVKPSMLTRVHEVLQQNNCEHRDRFSYDPCLCCIYTSDKQSLVCRNGKHEHTKISTYKHLNKLPCIVIVVYKGRVGDTFPPSFNCMDLRVLDSVTEEGAEEDQGPASKKRKVAEKVCKH